MKEIAKEEKEPNGSFSILKLKEEIMSLFREERIVPRRPPEPLLLCEWQMPVARKYSDYEASVLTPKMRELRKPKT